MTTPTSPPGLIRRLLTRVLLNARAPAWFLAILHGRMRADQAWSADYDALRRLEQAAARAGFGPSQTDLVERMILADVARNERKSARAVPLAVALCAGAAAAALLLFVGSGNRADEEIWTSRGGATRAEGLVGVRVRCIDGVARRVLAEAEVAPDVARGGLECVRGGLLSFALTNRSEHVAHVFIVGVAATGELRWYAPFVEGASSAAMAPGVVDELLPSAADTSEMPADGRVTLHALFTSRPLSGAEVARLVRGAAARGVSVHALERLPVGGEVEQGRLELLLEAHTK